MHPIGSVLVLMFVVGGCATAPADPAPPPPPLERDAALRAAAGALAAGGGGFAEEFLSAAGGEATPWVRPLLDNPDSEVRLVAQALLLSAGEDLGLSSAEEVDLILFDLARDEAHPYAGMRALERLRVLGDAAKPALLIASGDTGRRGEVARRLLDRWAVKP